MCIRDRVGGGDDRHGRHGRGGSVPGGGHQAHRRAPRDVYKRQQPACLDHRCRLAGWPCGGSRPARAQVPGHGVQPFHQAAALPPARPVHHGRAHGAVFVQLVRCGDDGAGAQRAGSAEALRAALRSADAGGPCRRGVGRAASAAVRCAHACKCSAQGLACRQHAAVGRRGIAAGPVIPLANRPFRDRGARPFRWPLASRLHGGLLARRGHRSPLGLVAGAGHAGGRRPGHGGCALASAAPAAAAARIGRTDPRDVGRQAAARPATGRPGRRVAALDRAVQCADGQTRCV